MGLRLKIVLFTVGIVALLTGLSLFVIKRSIEDQVHQDLARQLRQTRTVFETFMTDRASWLRSQCRVVAEDPRFTATLDILLPNPEYHERTVTREAERFQHLIGSDLFAVYGRDGRLLCRLEVVSDTTADLQGHPTLDRALAGESSFGLWRRPGDLVPLHVASVPIDGQGSVAGTFTIGYQEAIDGEELISDLDAVAKGARFLETLPSRRESMFLAHEMLKAFACDFVGLTDQEGYVLGVSRRVATSVQDALRGPQVQATLLGEETTGLRVDGGNLVQASLTPVWSGNDIIGALDTGFLIDREVAFGLRDIMQTEVSFVLGERILASTWPDAERSSVELLIPAAADLDDVFEMNVSGERYLTLMSPLKGVDPSYGARYLIQLSVDDATSFLTNINHSLLMIGGGVLLLAGLMSTIGGTRIVHPLVALSEATRHLAEQGAAKHIPVRSRDEVGDLTNSFNEMTAALTLSREALASSERLYRDLFESAQDVVYTADLSMNLISMNQVGLRLFGLDAGSVAGRSLYELVEPEDGVRLRETERVVTPGGNRPTVEYRVRKGDGTVVSLEVTTRWLLEGERPVGVHGIGRDVSARREREEATSRFREQLHQAEKLRALGEMAAGVAHNFNNLLTGVMGYAEIIKMAGDLPDHHVTNVNKIVESAKRCAAVIRRIQGFGRPLEASERHPVDINQVIKETIDITRPKWKTAPEKEGRQISVETELTEVGLVEGSESVWEEILSNLIFNAVDAMPDGGHVTLRSELDRDRVDRKSVV
jgi:PAS domain S-box-containing protein